MNKRIKSIVACHGLRSKHMKKPTKKDILKELQSLVVGFHDSHVEPIDGKIHDEEVLFSIECLKEAIRLIKSTPSAKSKPPKCPPLKVFKELNT